MFLLIGINPVKKVKDLILRRHCPHCNDIRNFQEVQYRQFLSFFFIPILPLTKPATVFTCVTCGYSISSDFAAQPVPENNFPPVNYSDRVVIVCPRCEGPMIVPVREHRLNVICPHCTMEFMIKGIKGAIPNASINNPQEI
ncbi:MAG: zinc-ribbon domain-containing protein [Bacteroidota bacterium]